MMYEPRGVARIEQGGSKNDFFSDLEICMSQSDMLRMAIEAMRFARGFGCLPPQEFFSK